MANDRTFPLSGEAQIIKSKIRSKGFERTVETKLGKRKRVKKKQRGNQRDQRT